VDLAGQPGRPDILVSGDARLVGIVTDGGGRSLSTLRRAKFGGEQWLRHDGVSEAALWPDPGAGREDRLACDALGCFLVGEKTCPPSSWTAGLWRETAPLRI
jgi:hypothetical protein